MLLFQSRSTNSNSNSVNHEPSHKSLDKEVKLETREKVIDSFYKLAKTENKNKKDDNLSYITYDKRSKNTKSTVINDRKNKWMFTSNQRDYINNRAPNASKYRKESESNTRSACKEVKNAFRENANLRNEICRIRSNTRIRINNIGNSYPKSWMTNKELNEFQVNKLKENDKRLKNVFGVQKRQRNHLQRFANNYSVINTLNESKESFDQECILGDSKYSQFKKISNNCSRNAINISPMNINNEFGDNTCKINNSCDYINMKIKSSCSNNKFKTSTNDDANTNDKFQTVIIKDIEESRIYHAHERELFNSYDPKFGNTMLKSGDNSKTNVQNDKNAFLEQQFSKSDKFRLPSFPFCKTCHKNNSEFLENTNFLMVSETGNGKILIPKSTFIKKLENGGFKISKDLSHPKFVKKAMENYQLKYGAHQLRDIDYDIHRDVRTGKNLKKMQDRINSRTSKSEY